MRSLFMRIAIIHEWFTSYAGSEKVVEQMLKIYPEADVFSVVDFLPETERKFLLGKKVNTSFIQKLPFSHKAFRNYLCLMPLAVEQFDLSKYDIILSSAHAVAKGVITGPNQLHISYVHSPIRYAWDLQHQYLKESGLTRGIKSWIVRYMLHKIRIWDLRTANGVDEFIGNSKYIAKRIWKVYRRTSTVIYPPVNVNKFKLGNKKKNFYVTASRMVPYKKMDLIVESFSKMPDKELIVIGDGPGFKNITKTASHNVKLLGYQDFDVLMKYMQEAKAFVFAAEEDFGITPVEAQACGTPVIAYGRGGALETVKNIDQEKPTGILFRKQDTESIISAVHEFEQNINLFKPEFCRENAELFSEENFRTQFKRFVEKKAKEKFSEH